ncbi:hypothetical protein ACFL6M_07210, partial [Candidatus Eisenbacteria bacterium]
MRRYIILGLSALAGLCLLAAMPASVEPESAVPQRSPDHSTVKCSQCHLLSARGAGDLEVSQPNGLCIECHGPRSFSQKQTSSQFHGDAGRTCLTCHAFHDSGILKIGEESFAYSYNNPSLSDHCVSCHNPQAV